MSWMDGINYVLFRNPVSSTVIGSMKDLANATLYRESSSGPAHELPKALMNLPVSKLVYSGNIFTRLGGISGAAAVILGAYGAHSFLIKEGYEEEKRIFQTANYFHFFHSLALIGVPLARYPYAPGSLFTIGMVLFCGTCYYDAFSGRKTELRKFTPLGGIFLIFGWLSFVL